MNDGIQTQVSINDRQLSVCEAVDKNFEEEYVEEINESSDKCREPENLDEFARNDMQAGSSTGSRGTISTDGVLSEDASVQECTSPNVQGRDGEDADQGQVD